MISNNAKKPKALTLILATALLTCLLFGLALGATISLMHFDPSTGVYSYDPQKEEPNSFFLANRPERLLTQSLMMQSERDGGFPSGAKRKLVKIEPVRVDLATYSDWAAEASVMARLEYDDGTVSVEMFRFRDTGSEGMLMPIAPGGEMSVHARFDRLGDCKSDGVGKSYCEVEPIN